MPYTEVLFYKDDDGSVPALDWLRDDLTDEQQDKCEAVIKSLRDFGFELRRPTTDSLRDGIRELRAKDKRVNLRLLYFFAKQRNVAVLVHGCTKEGAVDDADISRAVKRMNKFNAAPQRHTFDLA